MTFNRYTPRGYTTRLMPRLCVTFLFGIPVFSIAMAIVIDVDYATRLQPAMVQVDHNPYYTPELANHV